MKKSSLAALATLLCLLVLLAPQSASPAVMPEHCQCQAPDGSCSASITCRGGCQQYCGPNGDCYAYCSGMLQGLGMETTLQMRSGTYPQLVDELSRLSGRDISFVSDKPDTVFNAEFKKVLLWDVLDMLSDRGEVQLGGQDFQKVKKLRKILLSGTRINLCVGGTPVSTFVDDLASVTGLSLRIVDGRPLATVTVKLQNVTLDEILQKVSEQTGTRIVEEGADVGTR